MPPKLGIIAGGGDLPVRIIEACRQAGRPHFVLAFEGQTPADTVAGTEHAWVRLGAAGKAIKLLKAAGVVELVLAGPVSRPSFSELQPDLWAAKFIARVGTKALGDDGLLGAIVRELERKEGFRVVGAHDVLPGALAGEGLMGSAKPDGQAEGDVTRALEVARTLSRLDVGQAVVVQQGIVLAVEAIEGTDALLARSAELRRPGEGGVLVKVAAGKSEVRADLPTIGVATVEAAVAAGLKGIAVEAGAAVVIDRPGVVAAADQAGLFLLGIAAADTP